MQLKQFIFLATFILIIGCKKDPPIPKPSVQKIKGDYVGTMVIDGSSPRYATCEIIEATDTSVDFNIKDVYPNICPTFQGIKLYSVSNWKITFNYFDTIKGINGTYENDTLMFSIYLLKASSSEHFIGKKQ
jgi:hypothetical protein